MAESADPLALLVNITSSFPAFASGISKVKVIKTFLRSVESMGRIGRTGANFLLINGLAVRRPWCSCHIAQGHCYTSPMQLPCRSTQMRTSILLYWRACCCVMPCQWRPCTGQACTLKMHGPSLASERMTSQQSRPYGWICAPTLAFG